MGYKVVVFSTAERSLRDLPDKTRSRIGDALVSLADYPSPSAKIEKLKKPQRGYRRRVGDYRILLDIGDDIIFVHDIRNRKDAYRQ